jgi:uncharacterized membrane protein YjgN (DUF898 family)
VNFKFTGNGLELALLMIKNLFFSVITLGIYRPWATTNMRRYVWGNVTFLGDRAAYTGTGGELFRGWIKLLGLLMLLAIGVKIAQAIFPLFGLLIFFAYILIFALAAYSGLRYRLSRTLWRQIRFGVDKTEASTKEFLKIYIKGVFLMVVTLGIYAPWFRNRIRKFLTEKSRLGTFHFAYDGEGGAYAGVYFKGLLLTIVTLGIYTPWWVCALAKFRWHHSSFQGKRFGFDLSGASLFGFFVVSFLGALLTLGLATPWIYAWGLRLFADHTFLAETPDFSQVQAAVSDGSAMADDMVSGYDLDLGF